MKITLILVYSLWTTVVAFGQGSVIFDNSSSTLSSPPDRLVRFDGTAASLNPAYVAGAPVFSNGTAGLRAQLFYGASVAGESSLVAVTTEPRTFKSSTSPNVGTWFLGPAPQLAGFSAGDTVNLQVRVWDISLASSFDAAIALGSDYNGLLGRSQVFQFAFPVNPVGSPQMFFINNFQGFTIGVPFQTTPILIPEPSAMVLWGIGGGALWVVRKTRRKC